jgi:hypothetical protein
MWARNRQLTILTAASYLLAITASAPFHTHGGHDGEQRRPGVSASHDSDGHGCSVCQFLAQKPAPSADVAPVGISALVQDAVAAVSACISADVFAAWNSRAPPSLA